MGIGIGMRTGMGIGIGIGVAIGIGIGIGIGIEIGIEIGVAMDVGSWSECQETAFYCHRYNHVPLLRTIEPIYFLAISMATWTNPTHALGSCTWELQPAKCSRLRYKETKRYKEPAQDQRGTTMWTKSETAVIAAQVSYNHGRHLRIASGAHPVSLIPGVVLTYEVPVLNPLTRDSATPFHSGDSNRFPL